MKKEVHYETHLDPIIMKDYLFKNNPDITIAFSDEGQRPSSEQVINDRLYADSVYPEIINKLFKLTDTDYIVVYSIYDFKKKDRFKVNIYNICTLYLVFNRIAVMNLFGSTADAAIDMATEILSSLKLNEVIKLHMAIKDDILHTTITGYSKDEFKISRTKSSEVLTEEEYNSCVKNNELSWDLIDRLLMETNCAILKKCIPTILNDR